jgi:homoserine dehydrogenase
LIEKKIGIPIQLKKIADINITTPRDVEVDPSFLTTNAEEILADPEIEVVIELIGGYEPARTYVLTALRNGKHVVTANKALLSKYWMEIFDTASHTNTEVYFEASVGGAIPVIHSLLSSLAANKIDTLYGILNGTCNYILTKMDQDDLDFEQALDEAKIKGYAESDPTLDVGGFDTAHKLSILAAISFGGYVSSEKIYTEGIWQITKEDIKYAREEFDFVIKLLGIAKLKNDELELRVHPAMVPSRHLITQIKGVLNGIYIFGSHCGPILLYGQGAGKNPTASAVVGDLMLLGSKLAKGIAGKTKEIFVNESLQLKDIKDIITRYYIRFSVVDKPGVLSSISGILARHNISIASVVQKGRKSEDVVPIVMLTYEAKESQMKSAIEEIDKLEIVKEKSLLIRVEDLN